MSVGAVAAAAATLYACAQGSGNPSGLGDGGRETGHDAPIRYIDGAHVGMDSPVSGFDSFVPPPFDGTTGFDTGGPPGDAGYDAGLLFFGHPGSPCTQLGAVQGQACGLCGMATSTCIVRPDGGVPWDAGVDAGSPRDGAADASPVADGSNDAGHDAGAQDAGHDAGHDAGAQDAAKGKDAGPDLVWSEFGACTGQLAPDAGCLPGTQTTVSCGACGTETFVCEPDCEYGFLTACAGEVDGGCIAGSSSFTPDPSCDAGGAGTEKVCSSSCAWNTAMSCVTPPSTLTVSTTIGAKVDTFVTFVASAEKPLLALGMCPTTFSAATSTPFGFVTLENPNVSQTATVSVWTSQVSGQPQIDTAITSYATVPSNNAALKTCVNGVTDTCFDNSDPTSCLGTFGGLMIGDLNAVVIPAGGSVVVFVQDQFGDPADLGTIEVTARTESFP